MIGADLFQSRPQYWAPVASRGGFADLWTGALHARSGSRKTDGELRVVMICVQFRNWAPTSVSLPRALNGDARNCYARAPLGPYVVPFTDYSPYGH
jgi:hypothetical protein